MDVNRRIGLLKGLNNLGQPIGGDAEIRSDIDITGRQPAKLGAVLKNRFFIADELAQIRQYSCPFTGQMDA